MNALHSVNELARVPQLRESFVADLASLGLDGDECDGWALAFTELVNNAVEHGCRFPDDVVGVRWWGDPSVVWMSVTETNDHGLTAADFDSATCDDFAETGRGAGLFLIRAFADEIQVNRGPDGGVEIRIAKFRGAPGGTER